MSEARLVQTGRMLAGTAVVLPIVGWIWTAAQDQWSLLLDVYAIHNGLFGVGFGTLVWVMLPKQPRNGVVWAYAASAIWGAIFAIALPLGVFFASGDVDGLATGGLSPSEVPAAAGVAFQVMSAAWIPTFFLLFSRLAFCDFPMVGLFLRDGSGWSGSAWL